MRRQDTRVYGVYGVYGVYIYGFVLECEGRVRPDAHDMSIVRVRAVRFDTCGSKPHAIQDEAGLRRLVMAGVPVSFRGKRASDRVVLNAPRMIMVSLSNHEPSFDKLRMIAVIMVSARFAPLSRQFMVSPSNHGHVMSRLRPRNL